MDHLEPFRVYGDRSQDPYERSLLIERIKLFLRIYGLNQVDMYCLDLDGTLDVGNPHPPPAEIAARLHVRMAARSRGAIVYTTARTPELVMSTNSFTASKKMGLERPEPHWGVGHNSRRQYVALEGRKEFKHLHDPDVINSFGVGTLFHQKGGEAYLPDREYEALLGGAHWRPRLMSFLEALDPERKLLAHLSPIESVANYNLGKSDVYPLAHRIQFDFAGPKGFAQKQELKERIQQAYKPGRIPGGLKIVDESNPKKGRYTAYLIPRRGTKEYALDRMVRKISRLVGVPTKNFNIFIAGDTLTDLRAGCYGGLDASVTFMLAGGSRLTDYLWGDEPEFAGESLSWVHRYRVSTERGMFLYRAPFRRQRRIIIGDFAFPGKTGAESIAAYFDSDLFI